MVVKNLKNCVATVVKSLIMVYTILDGGKVCLKERLKRY